MNSGFATQFGYNGPNDFEDPDYVQKLARVPRPGEFDLYGELRRQVFHSFRNPEGTDNNQLPWPWIYGDAMDVPPANTPRQNASVSPTQYLALMAWAAGKFVPFRGQPGDPTGQLLEGAAAGSAGDARPGRARRSAWPTPSTRAAR